MQAARRSRRWHGRHGTAHLPADQCAAGALNLGDGAVELLLLTCMDVARTRSRQAVRRGWRRRATSADGLRFASSRPRGLLGPPSSRGIPALQDSLADRRVRRPPAARPAFLRAVAANRSWPATAGRHRPPASAAARSLRSAASFPAAPAAARRTRASVIVKQRRAGLAAFRSPAVRRASRWPRPAPPALTNPACWSAERRRTELRMLADAAERVGQHGPVFQRLSQRKHARAASSSSRLAKGPAPPADWPGCAAFSDNRRQMRPRPRPPADRAATPEWRRRARITLVLSHRPASSSGTGIFSRCIRRAPPAARCRIGIGQHADRGRGDRVVRSHATVLAGRGGADSPSRPTGRAC